MNVREKIVEALKTKFPGVEASIINRIADKLAKTVTTEEEAATAAEGVTFQTMLQSYGDARASEASATAVSNYEKKHNLQNGEKVKAQPEPQQQLQQNPSKGEEDQTLRLLQELVNQNKDLKERLDRMDGERLTATRKQRLAEVTKDLPEKFRKGYERIPLDSMSEEDFGKLVEEVTTEVGEISKEYKSKGAVFNVPSSSVGMKEDKGTANAQEKQFLKYMGLE